MPFQLRTGDRVLEEEGEENKSRAETLYNHASLYSDNVSNNIGLWSTLFLGIYFFILSFLLIL